MSKLIVPARLVNAAEELKNNYKALFACSDDVKEVMKLAIKQKLLCVYTSSGDKTKPVYVCGSDLSAVYCLSDDTEIITEPEKLQIPQWISNEFIVCKVETVGETNFVVNYPNYASFEHYDLSASLRCEGYVFWGWIAEGIEWLLSNPMKYISETGGLYVEISETRTSAIKPINIIATAWKKV